MPNYQNGKIYKLVNDENDDIYVGSTTQPLSKRFGDHKSSYKYHMNNTYKFITAFDIVKYQSCKIILIENFSCNSKYELEARERYYIDILKCVNKNRPNKTDKDNKQYKQQHYINNKQCYLENAQQRNLKNKLDIKNYQEQYKKNNKEKIKEYMKEYNMFKKSWGGLLSIKMDLFM